MKTRTLIFSAHLLVVAIAVIDFLAYKFFWYWKYWWLDMVMHFLGGLWVGIFVLWWYFSHEKRKVPKKHKEIKIIFIALFFVLLVGILWEVFELSVDTVIAFSRHNITDTLSDLFFDSLGAIASATIFLLVYNKKKH